MTSKNGGHEPGNLNSTRFRLGVDIGGTFTDGVLIDTSSGEVTNSKVLSTPGDPSLGFMEALQQLIAGSGIEPGEIEHVVHATTVATNAIIEGSTARAAFVTTAGFSDMLEIARQIRPTLYDLNFKKPPPLVPRRLCFRRPRKTRCCWRRHHATRRIERRGNRRTHRPGERRVGGCLPAARLPQPRSRGAGRGDSSIKAEGHARLVVLRGGAGIP